MGALLFLILIIPLGILLGLLLPVMAIVDIMRSKFHGNDNLLFILIVLFIPCGAIIYFILGPSKKIPSTHI